MDVIYENELLGTFTPGPSGWGKWHHYGRDSRGRSVCFYVARSGNHPDPFISVAHRQNPQWLKGFKPVEETLHSDGSW